MSNLWQDIRFGLRMLRASPAFTLVAVLTLALGIGANTAIFSVVDAVLLRSLPFPDSSRLVAITRVDLRNGESVRALSYPDFEDLRSGSHTLESAALYNEDSFTLTASGEPVHLRAGVASADLFRVLGISAQLGRTFLREEDAPDARVAMLSDHLWRQRFAADPSVLGRTVTLNGRNYSIVGVLPPGIQFPLDDPRPLDVWTTIAVYRVTSDGDKPVTEQRGSHFLLAIGRLKPGVTIPQANAEFSAISASLARQYPDTNAHLAMRPESALDALVGDVRPALWILLGAVGLVLLIACANVANLLLARATVRQREVAVRAAMGAARSRILRQLLTESLLLAVAGAIPGTLLAVWATRLLATLNADQIPRLANASVDWSALSFTLAATLSTAVIFGLIPALQASRFNLTGSLREGGRGGGETVRHVRLRNLLVVSEISLALMLLVGSGLLLHSLLNILRVPPGFDPHGLIAFDLDLPGTRYGKPEQSAQFFRELLPRLRALPGVESASAVMPLPFSDNSLRTSFQIEGRPVPKSEEPYTQLRCVGQEYFRTMRIPLVSGRAFSATDTRDANKVIIINQTLAKKFFPNENPLGKRIKPGASDSSDEPMREIVGVVGDVKHRTLWRAPDPEVYIPYDQLAFGAMTIVVRAAGDPHSLLSAIRAQVIGLDPELPLYGVRTLEEYISGTVAQRQFTALLLALFAGIALVLAGVGLYGVMSYGVAQRTHEIGIRVALGAASEDVLRLVVGQGLRLTALGLALGALAALAASRLLAKMLFGVSGADPLTFAVVAVVFLAIAVAACYVPARRAARVDPLVALRYE
ncbi:MAG TPA: ABC transporter permease [Patescibacteria group bacterium]|nr:ABC transporter permease [Patescibacteria group bacterium]